MYVNVIVIAFGNKNLYIPNVAENENDINALLMLAVFARLLNG